MPLRPARTCSTAADAHLLSYLISCDGQPGLNAHYRTPHGYCLPTALRGLVPPCAPTMVAPTAPHYCTNRCWMPRFPSLPVWTFRHSLPLGLLHTLPLPHSNACTIQESCERCSNHEGGGVLRAANIIINAAALSAAVHRTPHYLCHNAAFPAISSTSTPRPLPPADAALPSLANSCMSTNLILHHTHTHTHTPTHTTRSQSRARYCWFAACIRGTQQPACLTVHSAPCAAPTPYTYLH